MPSRRPPSQRDPEYAEKRVMRATRQQTPGLGTVANASPARPAVTQQRRTAPASGDSDHAGAGVDSTAVGSGATSAGQGGLAVGVDAEASGYLSTAVGTQVIVDLGADNATAVGQGSTVESVDGTALGSSTAVSAQGGTAVGRGADVQGEYGVALGRGALAEAARSIAIGRDAYSATDDRAVVKVNDVEVVRSSAGTGTSIILASPDGTRYRLQPPNGGGTATWVPA